MNKGKSTFEKKLVILGFDGLSPEILEPMMKEGRLPNFSYLKEKGSYSRLSTTNPSQSPVAWSSFATGKNPGKTAIFDFIVRDPKTYALDLSISNMKNGKPVKIVQSKAFWDYTSELKIPTVIITCPVTFPPDKIYGRMLSGIGVPDILGTEGTFTFYTSQELDKSKFIGGNVFKVEMASEMELDLIGPKVNTVTKQSENVKVPFKVKALKDENGIEIECQNDKFTLRQGQWSGWKEVEFKIDWVTKLKGIFKFYLVDTSQGFNLYISPINYDPRDPFYQISYPKGYSKELAGAIGLYYTQGMPMDTWAVNENRITEEPFIEQVNEVFKEKNAMLDFEMNRFEKGVLFCYFESSDIIQHMFWRYRDTKHPLYDKTAARKYGNMIRDWYIKLDETLGKILKNLGSKDTILVLSDHGFNTYRRSVHVNTWLMKNGYLKLVNENEFAGNELLNNIDWSKTKAYAIGFGSVYINQEGREKQGLVKPGKETDTVIDEIIQKMEKWTDGRSNDKIIHKVYKKEDIFKGPYLKEAPDLYIGFNIGYQSSWQTALGGVPDKLVEDNIKKWSGSHLFDPSLVPGVFLSNKKGLIEHPSIYDIAFTILKMIGISDKKIKEYDLDGTSLFTEQ
ncbi:MAG: alkaline phosphatase family protein [Elusimicrobia bacterium]|nr:alkaline phosphatase family protein [Candidatus Liberimonas magnetica]